MAIDPVTDFRTALLGTMSSASVGAAAFTLGTDLTKYAVLYIRADVAYADNPSVDAYAYLQGLLNSAASFAVNGTAARVLLPPGRFRNSDILEIPSDNVGIEGAGDSSIIDVSGVDMLTAVCSIGRFGSVARNFRVEGSEKGSQPANTPGATAAKVRLSGSGIVFAGCENWLIEGVSADSCGGLSGTGDQNGVSAFWITWGCTNGIITRSYATNSRNGINQDNFFQATPFGNKIIGNWVDGCRFGIADDCAADATDTLIAFNTVKNCQQSGIDLNKSNRVICSKNYIENCGLQNGNESIWAYGTSGIPGMHIIIDGNLVKGGVGTGVKMGPNVYYSQIDGNNIQSPGQHGVHIIGPCRHWSVTDNMITDPANDGVLVFKDGSNLVTTGNLEGNYVFQAGWNGYNLDGAQELTAIGNTSKSASQSATNTYDGFRLNNGVILSSFQGNHSSGGTQRYALAGVDSNTLGNTFVGNTFIAGASGRIAFANLTQNWGENGDGYITVAGNPTGTYPYGARVYNNGDQKLYINGSAGWRSVATV